MFSAIPLPESMGLGSRILQNMRNANSLTREKLAAQMDALKNQYYAPNILSEIAQRQALTNRTNTLTPLEAKQLELFNQYYGPNILSEIAQRQAQTGRLNTLTPLEAEKMRAEAQNPLLQKGGTAGDIGAMIYLQQHPEIQNKLNSLNNIPTQQNITTPSYQETLQKSIGLGLRSKEAETELNEARAKNYDWGQLPVEVKNTLTAQGYGMGIDPIKMKKYVSQGLGIKEIAEKEGLDPDNLPSPIYPPTTATKTRTQQVQQVSAELDYMSSATTPIVKQYGDTFLGRSPQLISDMLSSDPEKQKQYGRYVGALSVQTGLATGRTLLEGGKPGITVLKMTKDSALRGIDQNSPGIKMSKIAYEEAQKTIDSILQRGAKIRTTTGMNPFQVITGEGKESSVGKKNPKEMTTEEIRAELAQYGG